MSQSVDQPAPQQAVLYLVKANCGLYFYTLNHMLLGCPKELNRDLLRRINDAAKAKPNGPYANIETPLKKAAVAKGRVLKRDFDLGVNQGFTTQVIHVAVHNSACEILGIHYDTPISSWMIERNAELMETFLIQ